MARRTGLKAFALIPALAIVVAGCGSAPQPGEAKGVPLVEAGKLKTCTHLPYEPFQFTKDGQIVGFDVDLVNLVAKDLGVKQDIIDGPFETIESGEDLNAKKCDLAAAGMTIKDSRKQNFDFSAPYFKATQALLVKKASGVNSLEKLKGKKLGAQSATTGLDYANKHAKPLGIDVVVYEDLGLLLENVKSGQVDAGINDNGVLLDYAKKNSDLDVTKEFDTNEDYGIGVRKGNDKLRAKIDEIIAKAKSSGEYDTLYEKWFGKKPAAK
ncbi:ABC transporter substrate-binding protein [Allokutzneria albata]|uniref:Amino acid ABC transporter substrate-binding protein, PAAT family n=1 Tax=Allokutzneria albata TaxID=211114 RepID=A0A1G9ZQ12_ALLAB|nr:ABC transporter substrate-binding protein [Allokutzneria albata]SDN23294.1 amino acid ABC transporter substrate-binding protein, PAAT family [Allokutzneria albata]